MNSSHVFRENRRNTPNQRRRQRPERSLRLECLENRRLLAREVSGTITGDDTWTGNIHVTEDVIVPAGTKLTIDPSAVIKFNTGRLLQIDGTIEAVGQQTAPIIFTSLADDTVGGDLNGDGNASTPSRGNWEAIYVNGVDSVFEHVEVRYAGLTNGPFSGTKGIDAITIESDSMSLAQQTQLVNVTISNAFRDGVRVNSGAPLLQHVHVQDGRGSAFYFEFDANPRGSDLTANRNLQGDRISLEAGEITEDRTWDFGVLPIHVNRDVTIGEGTNGPATLTIGPGTIIKFAPSAHLFSREGTLNAIGHADQRIIFTAATDDSAGGDSNGDGVSSTPFPGSWESVYLHGRNNVLEYVDVRYAGDTSGTGGDSHLSRRVESIEVMLNTREPSEEARLTDVTVLHGYGDGVHVDFGSPILTRVHVQETSTAFRFALIANPDVADLTADNNDSNWISIPGGQLTTDKTWSFGQIPIHLESDLTIDSNAGPATLTIAPGTVVKLGGRVTIHAREGTLRAIGTEARPIIFTSTTDDSAGGDSNGDRRASRPSRGSWESILLNGPSNVLQDVEIRYAGLSDGSGNDPGNSSSLRIDQASSEPTVQARLSNVKIVQGLNDGLALIQGEPVLNDINVIGGTGASYVFPLAAPVSSSNLQASENVNGDRIEIVGGDLTEDRTWDFGDLPIHLTTSELVIRETPLVPATLTIAAGTVVKVSDGLGIWAREGSLQAIGTSTRPIIFTSVLDHSISGFTNGNADQPQPGSWKSIRLDGPSNSIENVQIRFGGQDDHAVIATTDLSIVNTVIESALAGGLRIDGGSVDFQNGSVDSTTQGPAETAQIFVESGSLTAGELRIIGHATSNDTGILVADGALAVVSESAFLNNQTGVSHGGIDVSSAQFTRNWWGVPDGPHDPSNLDGVTNNNPAGQGVSDYVNYGDFERTPPFIDGAKVISVEPLSSIDPLAQHRYEAEGNAFDATGNSNGIPRYNASYSEGRLGGLAFQFGPPEDQITLTNIILPDEWTLAAWVNPDSVDLSEETGILGTGERTSAWGLGIKNGNYGVTYRNNGFLDSGIAAVTDVWTHVAATVSGTNIRLYVDGTLEATRDLESPYQPIARSVNIGLIDFSRKPFRGRVDEVSILQHAITTDEVLFIKDSGPIDLGESLSRHLITFDRPIDATSASISDFGFTGPTPLSISSVEPISDRSFQITLNGIPNVAGDHTLSIGPEIRSNAGSTMNLDDDEQLGETPDDVFHHSIFVDRTGPLATGNRLRDLANQSHHTVTVSFDEPIDENTFSTSDVRLLNPDDIAIRDSISDDNRMMGFTTNFYSTQSFAFTFSTRLAELTVADPSRQFNTVTQRKQMIDFGEEGEFETNDDYPSTLSHFFVFEATGTITIPAPGPWSFSMLGGRGSTLEVGEFSGDSNINTFDFDEAGEYPIRFLIHDERRFNQKIELSAAQGEKDSFDSDFRLIGDTDAGGLSVQTVADYSLAGISPDAVIARNEQKTEFDLFFERQSISGVHELLLFSSFTDKQGNAFDSDGDGLPGDADEINDFFTAEILINAEVTSDWQSPSDRFNVNDDALVSPSDALAIINELAQGRVHNMATGELHALDGGLEPPPYYDVNGDDRITPLDALQVINWLSAVSAERQSEATDQVFLQLIQDEKDEESQWIDVARAPSLTDFLTD